MSIYEEAKKFKKRHSMTIAWRLKKNSAIVEKHINPDEKVKYVFVAQKNNRSYDIFSTAVIVLTDKRILIGRKRVVFGYFLNSVMPYMYNDLSVMSNLIWGKVYIDTVKELIVLSNIDKGALDEIETAVSSYMQKMKKDYRNTHPNDNNALEE